MKMNTTVELKVCYTLEVSIFRAAPPSGLFGLAMSPRSASHIGPNMLEWDKRCLSITGVNFRPMPSM